MSDQPKPPETSKPEPEMVILNYLGVRTELGSTVHIAEHEDSGHLAMVHFVRAARDQQQRRGEAVSTNEYREALKNLMQCMDRENLNPVGQRVHDEVEALLARPEPEHSNALAEFTEYFARNYAPNTIISDPHWHAPRIFRAAKYALRAADPSPRITLEEAMRRLEGYANASRRGCNQTIQEYRDACLSVMGVER